MRRAYPYALFLILVCLFLWRPIFTGKALLPGDYLAEMRPWNAVVKPSAPPPQWNPLQWDAIAQFYPWRVLYARSMSHGKIPLWNPYQFHGAPFLADGQSAVLYPPNVVFLLFDPVTAFTVFAALHLFLAAAFTYMLLRALGCRELGGTVGAVVFTFCAFTVLWLELPTFIGAAVYLPLSLLLVHVAVEKRSVCWAMLSGGAVALAFLAGHFQIAFYVAFAVALWWLWKFAAVRRSQGRGYAVLIVGSLAVCCVVAGGLVAAAQILPTEELAANSHRVREVTAAGYDRFVDNRVWPVSLVTAFVPDFFGNPSNGDYFLIGQLPAPDERFTYWNTMFSQSIQVGNRHWRLGSAADYIEHGLYGGIMPLLLALFAVVCVWKRAHVGYFVMLGSVALLTATGTPINYLFYYVAPGFSGLGGPNRILVLYLFAVAALAGFGIDWFAQHSSDKVSVWGREIPRGALATAAALGTVAAVFFVTHSLAAGFVEGLTGSSYESPAVATFAVLALVSAVVLFSRASGWLKQPAFAVLSVTLIAADLFAFGINYNPTCDRSKVYPGTGLTTELRKIAEDKFIAPINGSWSLLNTPDAILPPNAAMVYGLHDVQGYDSLYTRDYKDLSSRIQGEDSSPPENGNMVLVRRFTSDLGRLADFAVSSSPLFRETPFPKRSRLAVSPEEARLVKAVDGVYIYQLRGSHRQSTDSRGGYEPFSFRFGLFLTLVGIMSICCAGTGRALRNRKQR